jgi:hypothetical protein
VRVEKVMRRRPDVLARFVALDDPVLRSAKVIAAVAPTTAATTGATWATQVKGRADRLATMMTTNQESDQ